MLRWMLMGLLVGTWLLCSCAEVERRLVLDPGDPEFDALERPEAEGECATDVDCSYIDSSICPRTYACIATTSYAGGICLDAVPRRPAVLAAAECGCVDTICAWYE